MNARAALLALGRDQRSTLRVANDTGLTREAAAGGLRSLRARGLADGSEISGSTDIYWARTTLGDYVVELMEDHHG